MPCPCPPLNFAFPVPLATPFAAAPPADGVLFVALPPTPPLAPHELPARVVPLYQQSGPRVPALVPPAAPPGPPTFRKKVADALAVRVMLTDLLYPAPPPPFVAPLDPPPPDPTVSIVLDAEFQSDGFVVV